MSYLSEVLADSPASYWKLDGDPIAAATASSNYSANPPSAARDGNYPNAWITNATQTGWLRYELSTVYAATWYKIAGCDTPSRNPKNWTFEGSNDGSAWTVLDTRTNQSWASVGSLSTYSFSNTTAYKYYRLNVSANNGDTYLAVGELIIDAPFQDSTSNYRGAYPVGVPTFGGAAAGVGITGTSIAVSGGAGASIDSANAGFFAGQATFSANMWFKTSVAGTVTLLSTSNQSFGGSDAKNHMLLRMVDGVVQMYVGTPSGYASTNTPTTYNNGAWHMVTVTVGAGTIRLYIDGAQKATTTYSGSPNAGTGTTMRIGASNVTTNVVDSPWNGSLDEVSTYQTVLSSTRVAALYTAGTTAAPADITGAVSGTLPSLTAASAGAVSLPPITGAAVANLPSLQASVAGTHTSNDQVGAVAAALPALQASASGTYAPATVTGDAAFALPSLTGAIEGGVSTVGTVAATLPSLEVAVNDGSGDVSGALPATLPALSGGIVGAVANGIAENDPDDETIILVDTDDTELDFFPPLASAPAGISEQRLFRASFTIPALKDIPGVTFDPETGQPHIPADSYASFPVVKEEVGVPHVLFPNIGDLNDVTYFRGGVIQIGNMRMEEPFGDHTLELDIPVLTSMDHEPDANDPGDPLFWSMNRANVEIVLDHPDGSITRLWAGHVVAHDIGNTPSGPFRRLSAVGSLTQAASDVLKVPNMLDPTDIGTLIPRALNGVASRRYPKIGWVSTGIMSRQRGSWSDSPFEYAQSLLSTAWTPAGNQWTIGKVEGSRRTYELRPKDTTPTLTVTNGAIGVQVDLTRDATSTRNVIYGHGVASNGYAWWNYKYPNLSGDTAPLYPGSLMGLGASGSGVSLWQQRVKDLGYSIAVDGTISSSDVLIIKTVQRRFGVQVDGVIGPQTWAATFDVGGNGGDLSGVIRLPLAADPRTQPFLYNADGSVAGDNPDFDRNVIIYADDVDFGSGITRAEGIQSAQQILERESEPGLTGRIVLNSDPREMSRFLIRPGRKIKLVGFERADRVLHITAVDIDWQSLSVTLEVDEKSRDAMTVAQIRERDKEARRDPARRPGNVNRRSRLDVDQVVPFDGESGAGRIPKFATFGGLWSVIRIPVSETGRVAIVDMQTTAPTSQLFVAMFGAPIQPAHLVKYVGNPSSTSARWEQNREVLEDTFGWIEAFGSPDEPGGYWPGLKSNSSPLTGRLKDTGGFEYVSAKPPWVWVAVWTPSSSYVQGRVLPAPVI